MKIENHKIEQLRELLSIESQNIVIVGHANPDGDAIGSSLAWGGILESKGQNVTYVVPNKFPYFLSWISGADKIHIYKDKKDDKIDTLIANADIIFCMDFNSIARIEALGEAIDSNTTAKRILIDHHLNPVSDFSMMFSYPDSSSTAFLVYTIISELYGADIISTPIAEAMYVGIMTDTGNFSFSNLTPELFKAVAKLVELGINIPKINTQVYNGYSADRVKLLGYALGSKMELMQVGDFEAAYISLSEEDMRSHNFQVGDSEGFVNYPLSIKGVSLSAMFSETRQFIRISLRSRGDVDVNLFAKKYFEGGGHKNAAGGKSMKGLEETIEYFKSAVNEFFK